MKPPAQKQVKSSSLDVTSMKLSPWKSFKSSKSQVPAQMKIQNSKQANRDTKTQLELQIHLLELGLIQKPRNLKSAVWLKDHSIEMAILILVYTRLVFINIDVLRQAQ